MPTHVFLCRSALTQNQLHVQNTPSFRRADGVDFTVGGSNPRITNIVIQQQLKLQKTPGVQEPGEVSQEVIWLIVESQITPLFDVIFTELNELSWLWRYITLRYWRHECKHGQSFVQPFILPRRLASTFIPLAACYYLLHLPQVWHVSDETVNTAFDTAVFTVSSERYKASETVRKHQKGISDARNRQKLNKTCHFFNVQTNLKSIYNTVLSCRHSYYASTTFTLCIILYSNLLDLLVHNNDHRNNYDIVVSLGS